MKLCYTYSVLLVITALLNAGTDLCAQRISFGTWAGSDVTIRPTGMNTLDFGIMVKGADEPVDIDLSGATAFEITAPEGFDLTVFVDAPAVLDGPENKTIPLTVRFAYSNTGVSAEYARSSAIEVPPGFNSVTFPSLRRISGGPAPPPVPLDGDINTRTVTSTAYIYIYGSAGPAGPEAGAGIYEGTIDLKVDYTSYE